MKSFLKLILIVKYRSDYDACESGHDYSYRLLEGLQWTGGAWVPPLYHQPFQELCYTQMTESHWRALTRRLTRGGIRKETLANHFAKHIFMKDKEDVFMALVREIVKQ